MRSIIFILIALFAVNAAAVEPLLIEEGKSVVFENGHLSVRLQGKPVWSKKLANPTGEATHILKKHILSAPFIAIHAIYTEQNIKKELVALFETGKTAVRVIVEEDTQLQGDLGERTGTGIRFEDLDGDGKPEIVRGKIFEAVALCGKKENPLLFREVFDLKSGKFRPVLAKRVGLGEPTEIVSTVGHGNVEAPLFETIAAASASRTADDRGEVLFLSKPRGAVDDDKNTWWSPWPGNGAGEFVTFNCATNAYGITALGVQTHVGRLKKSRFDRPKSLLLKTETSLHRLKFASDPEESPDGIHWFSFDKPIRSTCLSLIVESSFEPELNTPIAISELSVKTEIDGSNGLERLVKDLGNPTLRRQASILLKHVGKPVVGPIRRRFKSLDFAGQRLAVEVVGEVDPNGAVDLLVEAALGTDAFLNAMALSSLKKIPGPAIVILQQRLSTQDETQFVRVLGVISAIGTSNALVALSGHAGKGSAHIRRILRQALRRFAASSTDSQEQLWALIQSANENGEWEKCIDLLRVAVSNPELHERVYRFIESVFSQKETFQDKYRMLYVLGQLDCSFSRTRLVNASHDSDEQIRAVALLGLGECAQNDAIRQVLRAGLLDPEPPVRLAALATLADKETISQLVPEIKRISKMDPWPKIRASAVATSVYLSANQALTILETGSSDSSATVRKTALGAALHFRDPRADKIIEQRLQDENEDIDIRLRAIAAVSKRCQKTAVIYLNRILELGKEPLAPFDTVELAVAAVRAMGTIGTPEARTMLKQARTRSNPATDKAIDNALANPNQCQK